MTTRSNPNRILNLLILGDKCFSWMNVDFFLHRRFQLLISMFFFCANLKQFIIVKTVIHQIELIYGVFKSIFTFIDSNFKWKNCFSRFYCPNCSLIWWFYCCFSWFFLCDRRGKKKCSWSVTLGSFFFRKKRHFIEGMFHFDNPKF